MITVNLRPDLKRKRPGKSFTGATFPALSVATAYASSLNDEPSWRVQRFPPLLS